MERDDRTGRTRHDGRRPRAQHRREGLPGRGLQPHRPRSPAPSPPSAGAARRPRDPLRAASRRWSPRSTPPRAIILMVPAGDAGRRDDRRADAAARPGRPDHRRRQRQLPRHPPPRRRGRGRRPPLPRRRRLRRRGGRAPRPLDHGRRPARRLGPGRADPRGDRREVRGRRPARPGWAPTAPATSSRPCTTASSTPTCR